MRLRERVALRGRSGVARIGVNEALGPANPGNHHLLHFRDRHFSSFDELRLVRACVAIG